MFNPAFLSWQCSRTNFFEQELMASSLSGATAKALVCGLSGSVTKSLRSGPIEEVGDGGAGNAGAEAERRRGWASESGTRHSIVRLALALPVGRRFGRR